MHSVLKLTFENNTAGTNLSLCAGTDANFSAGTAGIVLSGSGGPGFIFLTIVDTHKLAGQIIYVLRQVGSAVSEFTLPVFTLTTLASSTCGISSLPSARR